MKFKKLFLFIILGILFSLNITSVRAECYKHCFNGSECKYLESNEKNINGLVESACEEYTADDSHKKCIERKKKEYSIADEYFCDEAKDKREYDEHPNYDKNDVVSCGNGLISDIPNLLPKTIHIVYLIIQILVPIILVIFGSIDFVKSVIASKDDEINKGRQIFIKRLIYGVIVFFVFSIVKLLISLVGDKDNKVNIMNCASCLINNDSNCVVGES